MDGVGGGADAAKDKESAIQGWRALEPMTQDQGALGQLQKMATEVLMSKLDDLGLDGDEDGLDIVSVEVDDVAVGHMRVQQTYAGIPVYGGEAIVHILPDGQFHSVSDSIYRHVRLTDSAVPSLSADEAIAKALDGYPDPERIQRPARAELFVLRGAEDRLAWRVDWMRVDDQTHESPVLFVDAHTGDILQSFDELKDASGNTRYNGNQAFTSQYRSSANTYYLEDPSRKAVSFAWNGTAYSRLTDADDNWTGNDIDAVSAHFVLSRTVDYLRSLNQSMGLAPETSMPVGQQVTTDGTTAITTLVHVPAPVTGGPWNNASASNGMIWVGDGDGVNFSSFAALDVLGHEFGHCVVEMTSKLVYGGEPGALNESFADIFGAMVERNVKGQSANTWLVGEDISLQGGCGALRNMTNPSACGQPDHVDDFRRDSAKRDSGGVHTNSGIPNRAFTLAALGGGHSHNSSRVVQGIGADKAMRIWYRAQRWWMTARSDFKDAMAATIGSANTDFGYNSPEAQAVALAWGLVGVTSFDNVANGDFTQASTNWSLASYASIATPNVFWNGGNALKINGADYAAGSATQSIRLPNGPINAQLSFNLYVDTTEGTSYAYDKLFVDLVDAWGNTIRSIGVYSNMNKGFVSISPVDVSNLAGRDFRIQIIGINDSSLPSTFYLDNVRVDVTATPPAPDMVVNGDFENATSTAWTSTGSATPTNTTASFGTRAAIFGGADYATGTLKQEVITIPSSSPGTLTFQLAINTTESINASTAWDKLHVQVTEWGDTTPTTIKTYSNLDRAQTAWYTPKTIDLSAYRGSNINLQFVVENDGSLPTTFYVDNVSVK
ncbi:MAG: M4 family metallopeptidase [Polyangiaceae bacterium]